MSLDIGQTYRSPFNARRLSMLATASRGGIVIQLMVARCRQSGAIWVCLHLVEELFKLKPESAAACSSRWTGCRSNSAANDLTYSTSTRARAVPPRRAGQTFQQEL
jgi:hypothetical protein